MLNAAVKNGYTLDEICEAIAKAGMSCKKPRCDHIKKLVDDWLDVFTEYKEQIGLMDQFVKDILPF